MLEVKAKHPGVQLAIAHPDDSDIRKAIGPITSFLSELGIRHFWVSLDGIIEEGSEVSPRSVDK